MASLPGGGIGYYIEAQKELETTKTSTCTDAGKPGTVGAIKGGIIMGMVVQHNMSAINANRNLGVTAGNLAKSTEKLSSGYKINRAGDNAAGLAISEKMRGQIRGLDQASSNAEDGISMIQTAEGALTETHSILQRMRELAVQASSDTNTDDDRTQIQNEIDQLTQEVDRIATTTEFNTKKLIDGSAKGAVTEKAGKASVDSTFANSNVSAEITTDGSAKAAFTDVIRVEVTKDFTEGMSTKSSNEVTLDEVQAAIDNKVDIPTKLKAAQAAKETTASQLEVAKTALDNEIADALKGATASTANTVKEGTTEEELKAAVNALVETEKGMAAAGTETDGAIGSSTLQAPTTGKAIADLKALCNTSAPTALTDAIDNYAKLFVQNQAQQDTVDKYQKQSDILANTELVSAYADYTSLKADLDGGSTNGTTQADVDAAKAKFDSLAGSSDSLNVTDLFGNSANGKFEIASKVDKDNNLTITLKNKEGDDTVITISNADKMKAGDVITITAKEMVETEQAPTGKDAFRLQVGANAGQEVMLGINSMKAKDLNIVQTKDGVEGKALDVTKQASASLAVNAYDMAIQSVSTERAKLGATQNRLEHTISNLDTSSENLQSAESSLRDTDMAEEMTRYSKSNILQQAGQSMLAQANQSTQGVLNLLG